jgi:hypothetical protein
MAYSAIGKQVGGDHYKKMGDFQPFSVLAKWMTSEELKGFAKGTAIAYLAREADKGGRLDIEKAAHTLQLYLELTQGQADHVGVDKCVKVGQRRYSPVTGLTTTVIGLRDDPNSLGVDEIVTTSGGLSHRISDFLELYPQVKE